MLILQSFPCKKRLGSSLSLCVSAGSAWHIEARNKTDMKYFMHRLCKLSYCEYVSDQSMPKLLYLSVGEVLKSYAYQYDAIEALKASIHYFELSDEDLYISYMQINKNYLIIVNLIKLMLSPAKIWLFDVDLEKLNDFIKYKLNNLINIKLESGGIVISNNHPMNQTSNIINLDDY